MFILFSITFQAHVPHTQSLLLGSTQTSPARRSIRRPPGHCGRRLPPIPVRLPQVLVARGRQSGSTASRQTLCAPRQSDQQRGAQEASGLVRESQADQQRDGQERTGTERCM